jgi:hypothetical protein
MTKTLLSAGLLWFVWATSAVTCQFDTDCAIGSECIKDFGSVYGVCSGGSQPGNSFDDEPVYDPLDTDGTYGNTCRFDVDCGVGNECVKERGSLRGVCLND